MCYAPTLFQMERKIDLMPSSTTVVLPWGARFLLLALISKTIVKWQNWSPACI